jgi:hypothetical protein
MCAHNAPELQIAALTRLFFSSEAIWQMHVCKVFRLTSTSMTRNSQHVFPCSSLDTSLYVTCKHSPQRLTFSRTDASAVEPGHEYYTLPSSIHGRRRHSMGCHFRSHRSKSPIRSRYTSSRSLALIRVMNDSSVPPFPTWLFAVSSLASWVSAPLCLLRVLSY